MQYTVSWSITVDADSAKEAVLYGDAHRYEAKDSTWYDVYDALNGDHLGTYDADEIKEDFNAIQGI